MSVINAASTSLTEWRSSVKHTHTPQKTTQREMLGFKKGDRVKASAKLFDGNGTRDSNGLFLFSEKWTADGNGEWCYGTVSFVYVRRGRTVQKYRVKYDEGTIMEALENHLELVVDEGDSDEGSTSENEMGGSNYSDVSTVEGERLRGLRAQGMREPAPEETEIGGNVTSDSEGEVGEDNVGDMRDALDPLGIGDTVMVHDVTWQRIESLEEDARTEPEVETKFSRLHVSDSTREVDFCLQLMPLSK